MSKYCGQGHISKAKIVRKAKPDISADEAIEEECPKNGKGFSINPPRFFKLFGPKQKQILSLFIPSAVTYGITSLICICYLTEWKAVLQYVPLYRRKYFQPREVPQEVQQKKC